VIVSLVRRLNSTALTCIAEGIVSGCTCTGAVVVSAIDRAIAVIIVLEFSDYFPVGAIRHYLNGGVLYG
jgi:hypothetical protein